MQNEHRPQLGYGLWDCSMFARLPTAESQDRGLTPRVREHPHHLRGDHPLPFNEGDDLAKTLTGLQVAEHKRSLAPHPSRVAIHHLERCADHRRKVNLVDHEQVGFGDAGPPLRGILSPAATSITYSVRFDSSGLNVAARLSPPLSTNMMSRLSNAAVRRDIASRLIDASSRIAVCGQPPPFRRR